MIKQIGIFSFLLVLLSSVLVSLPASATLCPAPWKGAANGIQDCQLLKMDIEVASVWTGRRRVVQAWIRNGYLEANSAVPFKGNVIYYQGLGDSMLNHMPLFSELTNAGFRVIAFDYMGQGRSSGSMNNTRILGIGAIGRVIWKSHARDLANYPKRTIIGWSTGGLAAYVEATTRTDVDKIVLIAPGLVPNMIVGEQHPFRGQIDLITLPTLTTARYENGTLNPHIDPIKPTSPLQVPSFALDLSRTAFSQQLLGFRGDRVPTFILLSGDEDSYVDAKGTREFISNGGPATRTKVVQYPGTLHEIDNESEPMVSRARQDILEFIR